MKKFSFIIILSFLSFTVMAQMPKLINYQAVARNNNGQPLANQAIQVRLSIVNTAAGNAVLYSETRSITTNATGLFTVQIGSPGASTSSGSLSSISWTNNTSSTESLRVELDINNSGSFVDMGLQSLTTVPYAFASDKAIDAINIGGHYVDTKTPNTGDLLKWTGTAWAPLPAPKVYDLSTNVNVVSGGSLAFAWAAQPIEITIYEGQVITGVASATLGTSGGSATQVGIDLAYKSPTESITAFRPSKYLTIGSLSARDVYTVAGTLKVVAPGTTTAVGEIPAGTYQIGLALRNTSPTAINNSSEITGFITVQ